MTILQSTIAAQGQISVPAEVRKKLGIGPGSVIEWHEQDGRVVASALRHCRSRSAVELSECLVLEIARKAGHLPVGTFDRNFVELDDVQRLL